MIHCVTQIFKLLNAWCQLTITDNGVASRLVTKRNPKQEWGCEYAGPAAPALR
jgi:hypothetical protein